MAATEPEDGGPSDPFAEEVERIAASAEGRQLRSSSSPSPSRGAAGGAASSTSSSSPSSSGPLTADEISRLLVLCAGQEPGGPTGGPLGQGQCLPAAPGGADANHADANANANNGNPFAAAGRGWAAVDPDLLSAQVLPMLEVHVREAGRIGLVSEAGEIFLAQQRNARRMEFGAVGRGAGTVLAGAANSRGPGGPT